MNHPSDTLLPPAARLKVIVVIIVLCAVLGAGYVLYASQRVKQVVGEQTIPAEELTTLDEVLTSRQRSPDEDDAPVAEPLANSTANMLAGEMESPATPDNGAASTSGTQANLLVFVNRFAGVDYSRLAVANALQPDKRALVDLRCARMYIASGRGICLQGTGESDRSEGVILLFDEQFRETRRYFLMGIPSRARVSPDGSKAAYTIFVTGHSYTGGVGTFSTDTRIVDMERDHRVSLEDFIAYRNGERFQHIDFNYWGVTFADDANRFYATLGTQGKTYIVEGNVQTQRIEVIAEGGECPSLSPDNRSLVFKERIGGVLSATHWQLVHYDLATGQRTPLDETRSVDDQVEWLDNDTIIYSMPAGGSMAGSTVQPITELWKLDITSGAEPQLYLANAESPAVIQQTGASERGEFSGG